jgi:hypothetical protein
MKKIILIFPLLLALTIEIKATEDLDNNNNTTPPIKTNNIKSTAHKQESTEHYKYNYQDWPGSGLCASYTKNNSIIDKTDSRSDFFNTYKS